MQQNHNLYGDFSDSLDESQYKRFDSFINNLHVYREYDEKLLYIFKNNHVFILVSIIMLVQNLVAQKKTLQKLMSNAKRQSIADLFIDIKQEVFKEEIK